MKKNLKYIVMIILAFTIILSSSSYSDVIGTVISEENPKIQPGGTLIETSHADVQMFNPVLSADSASNKIENLIFEGLIQYDKDVKLVPCLASSWDISTDRLDYTFQLRQDVYWHDGEKFTADDVIFTWDRIMDPETDTTRWSMFESLDLENVPYEKNDEYSITFHLKTIYNPMLVNLQFPIIPQHVYENYLGPDGIPHTEDDCRDGTGTYTFNYDPRNTASQEKKPIGTGPMMFFEWEIDDHITLIRNSEENGGPGYWDGHDAYLSGYMLKVIPDVNVQLLALQNGAIHMMDLSSTSIDDIEDLDANPDFNVFKAPTFTSDHLAFQCDPRKGNLYGKNERDFETDPNHFSGFAWQAEQYPEQEIYGYKVRQALNYGLNKTKMKQVTYPYGYRNLGPLYLAQTEWYNEEVTPYTYNLTKANQLLGDAGFGYTATDPKRQQLNFTISYNQGGTRRPRTCYEAQDQWTLLGISVTIEQLEWVSMLNTHYDNRNFDMISGGWTGGGGDPDLSGIWHSNNIRPGSQPIDIDSTGSWIFSDGGQAGGLNYMSYWNPEVDELMEQAKVEINQEIRKNYYDYIQELIVNDSPYIWLLCHVNMKAVDSNFQGLVDGSIVGLWPAPIGFHNIYYTGNLSSNTQLDSSEQMISITPGFQLSLVSVIAAVILIITKRNRANN